MAYHMDLWSQFQRVATHIRGLLSFFFSIFTRIDLLLLGAHSSLVSKELHPLHRQTTFTSSVQPHTINYFQPL
jgi:hypothetical protein